MSLLATSLWQLLHGLVAIAIPAVCGFGLGVRWAMARRTRWKRQALRLRAERDALAASAVETNEALDLITARLRRLRTDGAVAPAPRRPNLHVIRTGGR